MMMVRSTIIIKVVMIIIGSRVQPGRAKGPGKE